LGRAGCKPFWFTLKRDGQANPTVKARLLETEETDQMLKQACPGVRPEMLKQVQHDNKVWFYGFCHPELDSGSRFGF